jgi:hypothetical protein
VSGDVPCVGTGNWEQEQEQEQEREREREYHQIGRGESAEDCAVGDNVYTTALSPPSLPAHS